MSDGTNIEWAEATWNPVTGCTRASRGCDLCYAVKMSHRLEAMGQAKYAGLTVLNNHGDRHFNGTVRLHESELDVGRVRKMRGDVVFVCSMSDLFHKDVPSWFIQQVFDVISRVTEKTFLVLTKRPDRMRQHFERHSYNAGLPNVWLGTSVEDREQFDARVPHLLDCPAALRFLSMEPLLDRVVIGGRLQGIGWVIAGGESGPKAEARPCDVGWLTRIVADCRINGVPCFIKQLGTNPTEMVADGSTVPRACRDRKGADMDEWPAGLRVREVPAPLPNPLPAGEGV